MKENAKMQNQAEQKKERRREERLQREAQTQAAERARRLRTRIFGAVGAGVVLLLALFAISNSGGGSSAKTGGKYPYAVGQPGPGQPAAPISLPSTQGGQFSLAAERGKTVLLYFQEGLSCQPCWDQLSDLERQGSKVRALGIDRMISITTDELGQIRQKAADEGLNTPILSDSNLAVSKAYGANQFGMMGDSRDGHSFIIIGPDGRVRWRADYGGAPNYTMYVPVTRLLSDMRKGLRSGA
ncbi:peroxiredoxin family protein [Paraconexibacter antarcticus]|uniref:Peroxiredoxin family protein n=1 Tax=Paraconexibacter antarcticus TaxID=2949664 RepID=A0ABY5DSQ3_9ACTN|nr:peroxiredoxin family protein [Paraconexibacter antarcticus]UTI63991.1 peroxiredoxin family protein [Paraconexibacter antarcticus]